MSFHRSALSSLLIVLFACLLFFAVSGEVMAAGGSTRLNIRIDQGVADAVIAWRKANGLPVPPSPVTEAGEGVRHVAPPTEAGRLLQRMLPVVRAGLKLSLHPQAADRIIRHLQQDTLIVFEGRAEHAGSAGTACVSTKAAGRRLTVHSI